MSRVSAWSVATIVALIAGIAALIAGQTTLALVCLALTLCMGVLGNSERKKQRR